MLRRLFRLPLMAALLVLASAPAFAGDVTVFAAASLTDALKEVGAAYKQDTGNTAVFSFAASSALARQIEASSGADIFVSADTDWMDYLDKKGLIAPGTRVNLLGNTLVLIAPAASPLKLTIKPHFDLLGALAGASFRWPTPIPCPRANTPRRR